MTSPLLYLEKQCLVLNSQGNRARVLHFRVFFLSKRPRVSLWREASIVSLQLPFLIHKCNHQSVFGTPDGEEDIAGNIAQQIDVDGK